MWATMMLSVYLCICLLFNVCGCFACMIVYMYMPSAHRGQQKASYHLELEWQTAVWTKFWFSRAVSLSVRSFVLSLSLSFPPFLPSFSLSFFFFIFFLLSIGFLYIALAILNSLCWPGWPRTQKDLTASASWVLDYRCLPPCLAFFSFSKHSLI